jgi:hypothetical protein
MHLFAGEPRVEQPKKIVGEVLPPVILGDFAPGRLSLSPRPRSRFSTRSRARLEVSPCS